MSRQSLTKAQAKMTELGRELLVATAAASFGTSWMGSRMDDVIQLLFHRSTHACRTTGHYVELIAGNP